MFEQHVKSVFHKSVLHQATWVSAFDPGLIACLLESYMGLGFWRVEPAKMIVHLSKNILIAFDDPNRTEPMGLATMLQHFVPADRVKLKKLIEKSIAARCGFTAVLRMEVSGRTRMVEMIADADVDTKDRVVAVIGTLRDVTQRAEKEAISEGRSMLFKSMMRNIPSAVAVLDSNMRYLTASNHWAAGHGLSSVEELIGKCHYDIFPEAHTHTGEHNLVLSGQTMRRKRSFMKDIAGNPIEQFCVMCPWYGPQGRVGGMIIMLGTVDINKTLKFAKNKPSVEELVKMFEDIS